MNKTITVETIVNAPIEKVWEYWTKPEYITKWNFASDDWECPKAENDLRIKGKFKVRMAAKNGKEGFDFTGIYTKVVPNKLIEYAMDSISVDNKTADAGRKVSVKFEGLGNKTKVIETFEPENIYPEEMQRGGWQSILNNFKKYVEGGINKR